jgi:hypothetical protein
MKIEELENWQKIATKDDIKNLELSIRELKVEMREEFVGIKEQFQRIKLAIWLPMIAAVGQILFVIFHR